MILIADSGSSKTDWRTIDGDGNIGQAKTVGVNPFLLKQEDIEKIFSEELAPQIPQSISQIYFYGAGCATPTASELITTSLTNVFQGATITVASDLLAAARALCGHTAGIACILGTGSNSCLYNGEAIVDNVPPLGYILGDEGSGSYIGKQLVNRYLKRDMPEPLASQFEKRFDISVADVLENTYKKSAVSRYLAGFSRFAFHHLKHPYIAKMIYEGFETFFERNVCRYENYQQYNVHFTGSIAFYYGNILRQVAQDKGISVRNIMETPIAGLSLYHQ